jgi:hypothetical protein
LQLQVAHRLAFSQQQLLRMHKALQVFNRMSRATADEGASVLQSMASLSISRVLESLEDTSNAGSNSYADQSTAAAAAGKQQQAAAAAAAASSPRPPAAAAAGLSIAADGIAQIDAVNNELQRHMRMRNIQACTATSVILDHMSKVQLAEMCVGELPRCFKHSSAKCTRHSPTVCSRWLTKSPLVACSLRSPHMLEANTQWRSCGLCTCIAVTATLLQPRSHTSQKLHLQRTLYLYPCRACCALYCSERPAPLHSVACAKFL